VALLDEHERQVQEQMLRGAPPLGPGAPPADRLSAFYVVMVDLLDRHLHLALGTEVGHSRLATGAYGFWGVYVHSLLVEARVEDPDALVDTLLAPDVYGFQRERVGKQRVVEALRRLAGRVLQPDR
jgi:hypothetical protein